MEVDMNNFQNVKALTFDIFGTVLDLGGSLTPYIEKFLQTISFNAARSRKNNPHLRVR